MTTIEKRPGNDWNVYYISENDDGKDVIEIMTIFGAMTIEEAIADAKSSFMFDEPSIVGAKRLNT